MANGTVLARAEIHSRRIYSQPENSMTTSIPTTEIKSNLRHRAVNCQLLTATSWEYFLEIETSAVSRTQGVSTSSAGISSSSPNAIQTSGIGTDSSGVKESDKSTETISQLNSPGEGSSKSSKMRSNEYEKMTDKTDKVESKVGADEKSEDKLAEKNGIETGSQKNADSEHKTLVGVAKRAKLDSGVKSDEEISEKHLFKDDVITTNSPNASNSKMPDSDGELTESKNSSKRSRMIKIPMCLGCKALCDSYRKLQQNSLKLQ